MSDRSQYQQLVKEVFGNDKGEKLLALWKDVYGLRPSYVEGINTEEVIAREGERRFVLVLLSIMQEDTK